MGEPRTKSGRIVKAPQVFVNEEDPKGSKRSQVGQQVGDGVLLGSLPSFDLSGVEEAVLRRLHSALYGTQGKQQSRKKALRDWHGNAAKDAGSRLRKAMASWNMEELRAVSRLCGLTPSKTKAALERALVEFLQKPYCVSPEKEPAKQSTTRRGTKRSVEEPSSLRAKHTRATQVRCDGDESAHVDTVLADPDVTSTRHDSEDNNDEVDAQFRQYDDLRRPTLVQMYPGLDASAVTTLVTREWEEILNGAEPEDAFKAARESLASMMAKSA